MKPKRYEVPDRARSADGVFLASPVPTGSGRLWMISEHRETGFYVHTRRAPKRLTAEEVLALFLAERDGNACG
jgi:hypothetical protein